MNSLSGQASARPLKPAADSETVRFARAVLNRPYKFTIILLVANLFVFLLMWQSSGNSFSMVQPFPHDVLIPFGAKLNYYIRVRHEWWRFITPMFLHINLLHLLINMYCLWMVGPYVEKLYGSAKFVVFWIVTGIAGVVASYLTVRPGISGGPLVRFLFKATDGPSAGASGALFGLVGVLFVFGIKYRRELPEGFKRAFGTGLLPMILMNLFIGYVMRGFIDNAAHLGGLASGAVLALLIDYRRPGDKPGMTMAWRVLQIAALLLVVFSFAKTAQHFRDPLPEALLEQATFTADPNTEKFVLWAKALNDGQEAFYLALKEGDVASVDTATKGLETAPSLDPKADELRESLKVLLVKAKAQRAEQDTTTKPGLKNAGDAQHDLTTAFVAWSKDYNTWLKTTGKSYGLVETTETESSK